MRKQKTIIILSCFILVSITNLFAQEKKSNRWKEWLDEVSPIMSRAEESVFNSLQTEEDRKRFQISFWKVRDRKPETIQNEYKIEYYSRIQYAKNRLGGINTDRGRIYVILGKPFEISNFSGYEKVVDCELWMYRAGERPGIPPYMSLLFYKRMDFGEYKLFYPGIHSATDILSPGYQGKQMNSRVVSYRELRKSFPELAQATLSVIPGEGSPYFPATATSSNYAFTQIFSLAEKEAKSSYLKSFRSISGVVDVDYSFHELNGNGAVAITEERGFKFLNCLILPDVVHTRKIGDNRYSAKLNFNFKIENMEGKTIYQRERNIDFTINSSEKALLDKKKAAFADFMPIITGKFKINVIFSNKTTKEFFTYEQKINIGDSNIPVLMGYKTEQVDSDKFMPFSMVSLKMFSDPRSIYNKNDSIKGIIFTEQEPVIKLINVDREDESVAITDIENKGEYFLFEHPLKSVKSSNYYLVIENKEREIYRNIISVLSFYVEKPKCYEWSDPPTSAYFYVFELAQQYMNEGRIEESLECFNRIPEDVRTPAMMPVMARAYYLSGDYQKVLEILEKEDVVKDYSVLLMMGNASLEIKKLHMASKYFEMLRKYGDTARINRVLGAIYLSLGEREKAKIYMDRAGELEKK